MPIHDVPVLAALLFAQIVQNADWFVAGRTLSAAAGSGVVDVLQEAGRPIVLVVEGIGVNRVSRE